MTIDSIFLATSLTDPALLEMIKDGFFETIYMTLVSSLFAYVIGLPLGVILVITSKKGIKPCSPVYNILGLIINILRSVPFLILLVMVIPITRFIVGTTIGSKATVVPLVIAAAPFVARLVESSLLEVDGGVIEAAQAMGTPNFKIITKVMIPEARPSLISNAAIAVTTILSYSALAGFIGGGGLGTIATNYGYYKYDTLVMFATVAIIVFIVQVLQMIGSRLTIKSDRRHR